MTKQTMTTNQTIQVVTIAGNDSDGSAGMPADLHSFFQRGVYGMGLLTAAVAGNSYGIDAAQIMPVDFIAQQFATLARDFDIRAAKTGMLADSDVINTVADCYQKYDFGPLVVDPVIITKHGNLLLEAAAYETFKARLIPLATVITPNFFEAQKLTGLSLANDAEIMAAAEKLQAMGAQNVLIKGRHDQDQQAEVRDYVLTATGEHFWLAEPFVQTDRVNGTGDSLSAVITAEIGKGQDVASAIRIAKKFVHQAIAQPIAVGHKYGPINHWATDNLK
jgi:hydroxymethylpyrimidine/phosphomethylpyrimidine kinase